MTTFLYPTSISQSNFNFSTSDSRASGSIVVPLPIRPIVCNPIFTPITPTPIHDLSRLRRETHSTSPTPTTPNFRKRSRSISSPDFATLKQPGQDNSGVINPELFSPSPELFSSPISPPSPFSLNSVGKFPSMYPELIPSADLPEIQYDLQLAHVHLQQAKRKCFQFWSKREEQSQLLYDHLVTAIKEIQTNPPRTSTFLENLSGLQSQEEELKRKLSQESSQPNIHKTPRQGAKIKTQERQEILSKPETSPKQEISPTITTEKEKHESMKVAETKGKTEPITPELVASIHDSLIHYSKNRKITGKLPCRFGCGKKFSTPSGLARHQRKHTGDSKRFFCPFKNCGKGFSELSALKRHHLVHTGERPFKCPRSGCGKSFCDASNLRRHQLMHDGEKPYKCPICVERFFGRAGTLRNHLTAVHKISSTWLKSSCTPTSSN